MFASYQAKLSIWLPSNAGNFVIHCPYWPHGLVGNHVSGHPYFSRIYRVWIVVVPDTLRDYCLCWVASCWQDAGYNASTIPYKLTLMGGFPNSALGPLVWLELVTRQSAVFPQIPCPHQLDAVQWHIKKETWAGEGASWYPHWGPVEGGYRWSKITPGLSHWGVVSHLAWLII